MVISINGSVTSSPAPLAPCLRSAGLRFLYLRGRQFPRSNSTIAASGRTLSFSSLISTRLGLPLWELNGEQPSRVRLSAWWSMSSEVGWPLMKCWRRFPCGDDDVVVPQAHIDLHRRVLADLPERHQDRASRFAVQAEDAATALLVGHAGVLDGGMDVALVTGDHPRRDVLQLAAAILDAAVVIADDADGGANLKSFTMPPRQMRKLFAMASGDSLVPMTMPFSTFKASDRRPSR